jgi:hypothetical protein
VTIEGLVRSVDPASDEAGTFQLDECRVLER